MKKCEDIAHFIKIIIELTMRPWYYKYIVLRIFIIGGFLV